MKMNPLGRTGLKVSELCLGSMTWGTQNTFDEGADQIDLALEHGINIIDCAEMYPVTPMGPETQGDSERAIGHWVKRSGNRDKVLLASKISGTSMPYIRDAEPPSAKTFEAAVDASLERMNTDYIDLYQLHWAARRSYAFRANWTYDPQFDRAAALAQFEEILVCADKMIKAGKIRHFGLSNETAWGTAQWLRLSEEKGLPRVVSMQNEYSLLCRIYDTDMAELSVAEDVGLLAYSPLATGLLTGKYQGGARPEGSRWSISKNPFERNTLEAEAAVAAYQKIADKHGVTLPQMSLAWCRTRPFMASAIFGATTQDQLKEALSSVEVEVTDEMLADIDAAHRKHAMPF